MSLHSLNRTIRRVSGKTLVMKQGKGTAGIDGAVSVAGLVILSLIQEAPKSGYDLLKEFESQAVSDWAQISKAQVYHLLHQLQTVGYVTVSIPEGARKRVVFEITGLGEKALSIHLSNPTWLNDLSPSNFMTWLGLAVHAPPDSLLGTLERRRDWLVGQIETKSGILDFVREYPSIRAPFGVRVIELYLAQLTAELRWIQTALEEMRAA